MPAAQHIGCVRTASTSKSAPYMARRRIKVKSGCWEDEGTDCEDEESDTDWYKQIESDTFCVLSNK